MSESFDLVIRNGSAMTPMGLEETAIGVRGGRIATIGDIQAGRGAEEIDAAGLTVLPGVIDSQVHFREPGFPQKEDLGTGTAGAVMGGVTAVFEMPNTNPLTLTAADLDDKIARADGRSWTDYAFFMGGAAENAEDLARLERLPGCAGVKVFMGSSTGSLLVEDPAVLARILANGTRRVAVHAEDEERLKERAALVAGSGDPGLHPTWRDIDTALRATQRLVMLARTAHRRAHVLHISTAEELELLADHRDLVSVEALVNHLTLVAPDCYERLGSYAQMNPPVRDARHRDALWRAVREGLIDVLGSDHAPHTREEKDRPYPDSPSGMPGVQTLVPVMLNHVAEGRLTLARFVDLVCTGPARVYGVAGKGRIARGYDADFTLVDLKAERRITNQWIVSRCGWTPFDNMRVTGWPMMTIIRGRTVMRESTLIGDPAGEAVRFHEADGGPG